MKLFLLMAFIAGDTIYAQAPQASPTATAAKPFRVSFTAHTGGLQGDEPSKMCFLFDTLDWRMPFCFPMLGEQIPHTKLKLAKFAYKTRKMPDGETKDVSELTLVNFETQETAVLILGEARDVAAIAGIKPVSRSK